MKELEFFRCKKCGNVVLRLSKGQGELVCCGEPMEVLDESSKTGAEEKHLPVVNKLDKGYEVKVGEVEHPMEEKHLIEWILGVGEEGVVMSLLSPQDSPVIRWSCETKIKEVFAYCNLHSLWRKVVE